jgi:hypothetical protein
MRTMTQKREAFNTKVRLGESLKKKWESRVMHDQYIRIMDRQLISEEDTLLWLSTGDLKGKTESDKIAAQDQALQTRCHMTKILLTETDSKCRLCQFNENSTHHISMPNIALQEQYVKRHDRVCTQLHFDIYKEMGYN